MKYLKIILLPILCLYLGACLGTTESRILEYDQNGNIVRESTTSESLVKPLLESMSDKTVIVAESGWRAFLSASMSNIDDPTPTVKTYAGKSTRLYMGIHKNHANIIADGGFTDFWKMLENISSEKVSISATSGVSSR